MRSLDTNTLLRLVLDDVPAQAAAVEKLLTGSAGQFAVADLAFAEMVWILSGSVYRQSRPEIVQNIQAIARLPQIHCNRVLLERALPLYLRHANLSFIDCCLSVHAELNKAVPLLTFDKNLAKKLPKQTELVAT